jgi:hypothetical protein
LPRFQLRFSTQVGELTVVFDSDEELKKSLQEVPGLIQTIAGVASELQVERKPPSGFEDLCSIDPTGAPRLLKHPKKKSDVIRLALFLALKPLTLRQLQDSSGVSNPTAYVAKKDLLRDSDGRYSLESGARAYVLNTLIPSLRSGVT